jgi:hypothetical protein
MRHNQIVGLAKIGVGGIQMVSGVMAVCGKGLTAKLCNMPGGPGQGGANLIGHSSFKHGLAMVQDGLRQCCR